MLKGLSNRTNSIAALAALGLRRRLKNREA